jgi:hypothetical protein
VLNSNLQQGNPPRRVTAIGRRCALSSNLSLIGYTEPTSWNYMDKAVARANFWSATSSPTCSDDSCVSGQVWIYEFKVGSGSSFQQTYTAYAGTAAGVQMVHGCAFRSLSGTCDNSPISTAEGTTYGAAGCEWLPVGG